MKYLRKTYNFIFILIFNINYKDINCKLDNLIGKKVVRAFFEISPFVNPENIYDLSFRSSNFPSFNKSLLNGTIVSVDNYEEKILKVRWSEDLVKLNKLYKSLCYDIDDEFYKDEDVLTRYEGYFSFEEIYDLLFVDYSLLFEKYFKIKNQIYKKVIEVIFLTVSYVVIYILLPIVVFIIIIYVFVNPLFSLFEYLKNLF